jgi:exopolyphosphatase/guanosine-5'-triphosphate,3'-diphosphate pyrophosphatase
VLVTSPGRQAENGGELLERLLAAAQAPVRLLSATEEGRLAFYGATSRTRGLREQSVAVCDVGGGSAQVTVGTRDGGPAWTRSVDVGSMRLTSRLLAEDPPGEQAVLHARSHVRSAFDGFLPPRPHVALAVGGSARALRTLVGGVLRPRELEDALELLAATPSGDVASTSRLGPLRTRTLTAGAIILAEISTGAACRFASAAAASARAPRSSSHRGSPPPERAETSRSGSRAAWRPAGASRRGRVVPHGA